MADETFVLDTQVDDLNNIAKLTDYINKNNLAVVGLTQVLQSYNKTGKESSKTVQILLEDLKTLQATIGARGGLRGIKILDFGDKEKAQLREGAQLAKQLDKEIAEANKQQLREGAQLAKQIDKEIVDREREQFKTASAHLRELNKQRMDAEKEYIANMRNNQAIKAKSIISNDLSGRIGGLDIGAFNTVQTNLNSAASGVRSGNLDPQRFIAIYAAIKNNQPFTALSREEERAEIALRRLLGTIENFEQRGNKAGQGFFLNMSQIVRILQVQVFHRIFGEMINSLEAGVQAATEFQIKIAQIQTISQENQLTTKEWSKSLIELSNNFNIPLLDATQAAYDLISNQIARGADSTNILSQAFKFAKVTGATAKESVDLLSFTLNAFKLTTDDSERVLGLWFKTIDLGNITAQQLALNIGNVLPFAKQLGISLEEVGVGIEALTVQGIQADTSMTLLKNIFKEFVKPTTEMKELFREWGVTSGQAAFQTFGLLGVLQRLDKELQSGGPERLGQLTDDLRALSGTLALSGKANLDVFQKGLNAVTGSTDKFRTAFDIVKDTPAYELTRGFNELKNSFIETGDEFVKMAAKINNPNGDKGNGLLGGLASTLRGGIGLTNLLGIAIRTPNDLLQAGRGKPNKLFKDDETLALESKEIARAKAIEEARAYVENPELRKNRDEIDSINKLLKSRAELASQATKGRASEFKNLTGEGFDSKGFEKAQKAFDKLIEKAVELKEKILDAFETRQFEKTLDGLKIFETIEPIANRIAELKVQAYDFFNVNNIDEARKKFEEIQKLTDKTNDNLQKQIEKSIEALKDNAEDKMDKAFERSIRGKSGKSLTNLYVARAKELRDQAFALVDSDPDQARKTLDKAIKTIDKANDADAARQKKLKLNTKKKLPGDELEDEFANDRDRLNNLIKGNSENSRIDEKKLKNERLDFENQIIDKGYEKISRAQELLDIEAEQAKIAREMLDIDVRRREELERRINLYVTALAAPGSVTRDGSDVPLGVFGGFASGGLLHGPMGRDNLLIRAHAGEYIVNSEATAKFMPQLIAMNSGMEPRGFAGGGPVTNVGDINVSVQGQDSVQSSVREIGYALRREIKRGSVRLS